MKKRKQIKSFDFKIQKPCPDHTDKSYLRDLEIEMQPMYRGEKKGIDFVEKQIL